MFSANSDDREPPGDVFLDTSIFMASLKHSKYKELIHSTIGEFRWRSTASHAKLEYGKNVLSVATYCYGRLQKCGNLEDLKFHILHRLVPERFHRKRVKWSFALLEKFSSSDPEATERALCSLRQILRTGTDFVLDLCDDPILDEVGCIWAEQRNLHEKMWKAPSGCGKARPGCRVVEFFRDNLPLFRKIRERILQLPPEKMTDELAEFADIIAKAESDPGYLRNHKVCLEGFADAIMSVQSRSFRSFFTQDFGESSVLCSVIGQTLLYLEQDPHKPVTRIDLHHEGSSAPDSC